ncbi:MAG: peroxiredoxin-like family protein [Cyanobacteria bacterium P01_A01_bin.123]
MMPDVHPNQANPSLTQTLTDLYTTTQTQLPETARTVLAQNIQILTHSGIAQRTLQIGDRVPNFSLANIHGNRVELQTLLSAGPVVISFYRGTWCSYCNAELAALQDALPAIEQLGATLIAISPQQTRHSRKLIIESGITYETLIDTNNQVARQLGLVFELTTEVDQVHRGLGISIRVQNATRRSEVPIPATYIVRPDGEAVFAFVNPDYTARLDPVEIITVLRQLQVT